MSNLGNVFVTPNGEVFFCDRMNHRVRKVLRTGETVTIAGTGIGGYNGDDQPATQAQLQTPICVVVSPRNEVYISEATGHRIRKILTNGNIVTVAGNGEEGYNGDYIPATEAEISAPYGIFVTEQDELYIAEYSNYLIRKVCNGMITTMVGSELRTPSSVFVSKTNEIYIVEYTGQTVKKVNTNGTISTIAGTGIAGYNGDGILATSVQLNNPWFLTVFNDEVYIADFSNNRIRKILRNGNMITIAGTGRDGKNGDGVLATEAQLFGPTSVFVTSNEIYISEYYGCRIRKINSHGIISTIVGNGTSEYSGDVPFDFQKYPHIGAKIPPIKPFPKSYLDISIHFQIE